MGKREKPAEGSGPPPQEQLPPTATELDARVRSLEEARLEELGFTGEEPPAEAPPGTPPTLAVAPDRDWLDRALALG